MLCCSADQPTATLPAQKKPVHSDSARLPIATLLLPPASAGVIVCPSVVFSVAPSPKWGFGPAPTLKLESK